MSDKRVQVTDRRMFTLDGELRDEFQYLADETRAPRKAAEPAASPGPPPAAPPPAAPQPAAPAAPPGAPQVEGYPDRPASAGPGILDLVGLLAEPASIYLREASSEDLGTMVGDAQRDQNLELARLHIDLLEVLQQKTASNLDHQERAMLDDVIYRLRLAYVQTRG